MKDFGESREHCETDKTLAVEYPNLDLESAWLAFADRHQDETRTIKTGRDYGKAGANAAPT